MDMPHWTQVPSKTGENHAYIYNGTDSLSFYFSVVATVKID